MYVVFAGLSSIDLIIWRQLGRCQSLKNMRCEKKFQEKKIQGGIPYLRVFKGIRISLHVFENSIVFNLLFDYSIECY